MTRVKCGHTSCVNNEGNKDGYYCTLKNIHLAWVPDDRMVCLNKKKRKEYAGEEK